MIWKGTHLSIKGITPEGRTQRKDFVKAETRVEGKLNTANIEIAFMKTLSGTLRQGRRFPSQQDSDPKHRAKTMQEWQMDNSVNVLEWPSKSLGLNLIEHLWRNLKISVNQ